MALQILAFLTFLYKTTQLISVAMKKLWFAYAKYSSRVLITYPKKKYKFSDERKRKWRLRNNKKKQTFLDKINQKSLLTSFDVKIFSEWISALIELSFEIYIRN